MLGIKGLCGACLSIYLSRAEGRREESMWAGVETIGNAMNGGVEGKKKERTETRRQVCTSG